MDAIPLVGQALIDVVTLAWQFIEPGKACGYIVLASRCSFAPLSLAIDQLERDSKCRPCGCSARSRPAAERSFNYCLHPAHLPVREPHLDAVGMGWAVGEDRLHDALRQFAAPLVLLQDDIYADAWLDLAPLLAGLHMQQYMLRSL